MECVQDSLVARLECHEGVDDVVPVPRGYVPCVKLTLWKEISIDLTFCIIPLELLTTMGVSPDISELSNEQLTIAMAHDAEVLAPAPER